MLAGTEHFSVLNARMGIWQLREDMESSKPFTFNTCFERFC